MNFLFFILDSFVVGSVAIALWITSILLRASIGIIEADMEISLFRVLVFGAVMYLCFEGYIRLRLLIKD